MNEFEQQVIQDLAHIRENTAKNTEALNGLAGPQGRVTAIERKMTMQTWQTWAHTVILIPVLAGLAGIAKALYVIGIKISGGN